VFDFPHLAMNQRFALTSLVLTLSFVAAACSPQTNRPVKQTGTGSQATSSVDQNSFEVEPTEATVAGQTVFKFTYPTTRAARLVAARLSDDGMIIGTKNMQWKDTPHFFRKENEIVLYVGNDPAVLAQLKVNFGDQFAGK
jgi:hypothetical protein